MPLPPHGKPADEVLADLADLAAGDLDWRAGRAFSLVYTAGPAVQELLKAAAALYSAENALNTAAFPSLGRMQADIAAITAGLLRGGPDASGFLTSGGTESLLLAVKVARDWGEADRGITEPEVVLATSAHAAFAKAAHWFGVREVRVRVDAGYRADVDAMAAAMTDNTVLVVGSAPTYPQGVMDPIPELAALAAERGVLCHVDACMGGYLLPFLERLDHLDAPWDFRVEGVTSISADLHKYGYASKGVSTITYRNKALRRHQPFRFDGWLGGLYGSSGMAGTKPAGPIAAAWAVLHHLGEDGYLRLADDAWHATQAVLEGVRAHEELAVLGKPDATLFALAAAPDSGLDAFAVGDELQRRGGWYLDRQTPPDSLHATINAVHRPVIPDFLADLDATLAEAASTPEGRRDIAYGTVE